MSLREEEILLKSPKWVYEKTNHFGQSANNSVAIIAVMNFSLPSVLTHVALVLGIIYSWHANLKSGGLQISRQILLLT